MELRHLRCFQMVATERNVLRVEQRPLPTAVRERDAGHAVAPWLDHNFQEA